MGRSFNHPGDRAVDRSVAEYDVNRPPVLSRPALRWLCVASLAVIIYGTLGPLGTGDGPWLSDAEGWRWLPMQQRSDVNDVITNLLVYIPVGAAFRLLIRRRGLSGWPDFAAAAALSVGLSYGTELCQQFMPARSSNLIDIYVNGVGAIGGCMLAVPLQRALRLAHKRAFTHSHLRDGTYVVLGWGGVLVAFVLMTYPWELKRPQITHGFDQPLELADPLRFGRFAAFTIVGYFLTAKAVSRGRPRGSAARRAVLKLFAFASLLELAQSVLGEHVSSILHACIAGAGATLGALLAHLFMREDTNERARPGSRSRSRRREGHPPLLSRGQQQALGLALAGIVALIITQSLWPAIAGEGLRADPEICWAPFHGHYNTAFTRAVVDILQQCTIFGILTVMGLYLTQGRRPFSLLVFLLAMVGLIEVCQAFIAGHGAGTTSFVLVFVAWLVATRAWRSLYPRRSARGTMPAHIVSQSTPYEEAAT